MAVPVSRHTISSYVSKVCPPEQDPEPPEPRGKISLIVNLEDLVREEEIIFKI